MTVPSTCAGPSHILLLGSTGSIGTQALEVIAALPDATVCGLAAGRNIDLLERQAGAYGVNSVWVRDQSSANSLAARAPSLTVGSGEAGLHELIDASAAAAQHAHARFIVLNGIVGAAGLRATIAALRSGATVALANKESLVAGGPFVLEAAKRWGGVILPVDSEHSAIFQCLAGGEGGATRPPEEIEEIILTGSGGPFRGRSAADMLAVAPAEALAHPTWTMGAKISIDSATLMNKGLEVIEAHRLFEVPYERLTVLINPQSTVHSMVRFTDGAILAHLGVPDMRTPIGYALAYPQRPALPMVRRFDFLAGTLTFEAPDTEAFPCLTLAREAGRVAAAAEAAHSASLSASRHGATAARTVAAPIVLNAANEIAVQGFLEHRLRFPAIPEIVERCLTLLGDAPVTSLDDVYACDDEARRFAREAADHLS
mgnify:CR=1 FL=1